MPSGYDDRFANAPAAPAAERSLPGLDDDGRLPWLDASDDPDSAAVNPARVWAVLVGVALLIVILIGAWWAMHRSDHAQLADGSLIAAPPGPIKEAPQDPGGKTFDGTGDSSFTVSQGHLPGSSLAGGGDHADAAVASGEASSPPPDNTGAVGVQLGAFSTELAAQAAWDKLAKTYDALSGTAHRIVEAKADIGTVYRLQAVAGSDGGATALCERLKAAGLNCQVQD